MCGIFFVFIIKHIIQMTKKKKDKERVIRKDETSFDREVARKR